MTMYRSEGIGSLLRPQYLMRRARAARARRARRRRLQADRGSRGRRSGRAAGSGRPRRRHRRRAAALRVLRPPGRGARWLRQVRRLGDHRSATSRAHERRSSGRSSSRSCDGGARWRRRSSPTCAARTKRPVKVTLVSAQQAAAYYDPDKSRGAYPTRDAYLADLVDFTRREIAGAAAARLRVRPDRRAAVRGAARRDDPRGLPAARQRSRRDARRVHRARQRDHRGPRRA